MTKRQFDLYTMFLAVITYLIKIPEVIAKSPALVESFGRFQAKVALITKSYADKQESLSGNVDIKHVLRDKLEDLLSHIFSALRSYAIVNKLADLLASSKLRDWQIDHMRDDEILLEGERASQLCDKHSPAALNSEFTADDVADLKTAIVDFRNAIGEKETGETDSKTATASLANLLKESKNILTEEMDEHFEVLRKNYREQYDKYLANRKVVATGVRHKKNNGNSTQPADGTTPQQ